MRPVEILIVEDNPADAELAQENLQEAKILNRLHVVEDGEQAMEFLRQGGTYASAPTPDLILLDLNLPKRSGREVLAEIKSDRRLYVIPVVVLTSSEAEEDVVKSYALHANAYVRKPIDLAGYQRVVHAIEEFWLGVVKYPGRPDQRSPGQTGDLGPG